MRATRILQLLPSWEHVGALGRIGMLAAHIDPDEYAFHVVALSSRGPDPRAIVGRELPYMALASGRRLAVMAAWGLRRVLRDWRAEVVHAWTPAATWVTRPAMMGLRGVRLIETTRSELPPAVDVDRLRREARAGMTRDELLAAVGLPPGTRLLGIAGRLTRAKHIIELLWALDQIRCVRDDVYLLIIGDGDARPLYERYARLYEVVDHVRFLGWRSDAAALLASLDVYCSASYEPACSLAMLEAMALGVPVVASDTAAHRSLVVPGETGFLADPTQRSEIARWCLRVLEDPVLANRMSEAGRQRAIERFGVEPFLAAYREVYRPAPRGTGDRRT